MNDFDFIVRPCKITHPSYWLLYKPLQLKRIVVATLEEIENRVEGIIANIRSQFPDWSCQKGCDECCRRLAELPLITRSEWSRLKEGLIRLPEDEARQIQNEVKDLARESGPLICPLLNQSEGACKVYPYRPLACRSYGYFIQKGVGLHCKKIEAQVNQGALDRVVWGNQDALERDMRQEGAARSLHDWFIDPVHGLN